ncbi:MAG: response regulator [Planctomycetes bacterium]|nr:response regulator [Planctomycetota bacterium]
MKILIADDESIIRMDLHETLEAAGHQVVAEASDGREAVRLAEELLPDAVLLDIKMPKMTGLAAAERITKKKIAPCVVLTAYRDRTLIDKAKKSGAYTFLTKPFKEPELLAALAIAILDDGKGLPADFSLTGSSNLGLRLVRSVVEEDLKGTFELAPREPAGTRAILRVPL